MSEIGSPACFALDVEADLVEWAVYTSVSIPAFFMICLIQLETVGVATGLCGLIVLNRSMSCSSFSRQSLVLWRYALMHSVGSRSLSLS